MFGEHAVTGRGTRPSDTVAATGGHDAWPVVSETLDFNNRQALIEAHQQLTQVPALTRFCDEAFGGVDEAANRTAVATLILCLHADARTQRTDLIPGNRDDALTTLARRLTPTGETRLRQSLGAHAAENPFSQRLAQADRLALIAHVYRNRFDELEQAFPPAPAHATRSTRVDAWVRAAALLGARTDACEQAVNHYEEAARAYTQAGRPAQVAATWAALAALWRQAGEPAQAVEAARNAVLAYREAEDSWQAANALVMVAEAEQQANRPAEAATAFLLASDVYTEMNAHAQAARLLGRAAPLCEHAFGLEMAITIYTAAAHTCLEAHEPKSAAIHFLSAAEGYAHLGQDGSAAERFEDAAHAWLAEEEPDSEQQALRAFEAADQFFMSAAESVHARAAGFAVAHPTWAAPLYGAAAGWHERSAAVREAMAERAAAEEAFGLAADNFAQAGECDRAAGKHQRAATWFKRAATAYGLARLPERAATALAAANACLESVG